MSTNQQPESRYLAVNGLRLHHMDWGNPSAPHLVYVHGLSGTAHGFDGPAHHFRGRFHNIATDVRGRGESQWSPAGAYQYGDYASDLEGIVDQLGLERFTLVGTSMGGVISMAYAGANPGRLERLVINDIGPDLESGSQRIFQAFTSAPDEFASLEEALTYLRQARPVLAQLSKADHQERALYELRQEPAGRWVWKMDPAIARQWAQHGGPAPRPPLWPVLERISCPTMVVWGMESDVLSEAQARRMVEVLPRGQLVAVPGVGHAPPLMEPVALAALERFLADAE